MDGKRAVLGMWAGENESSKYWLGTLNGLRGLTEAINAIYPKTEIQQDYPSDSEQHTLRSYKDLKVLMADLKAVYSAVDEETALYQLNVFSEKSYPQEVRTLIYTTNSIENFNRQLRKVTKAKTIFPTDDSLLKMLYLAMMDITKKWTGRRRDWGVIHSQLEVCFADRLPD